MGNSKIEWVAGPDGSAGKTWNPIKARLRRSAELVNGCNIRVIPAGKVGYHCERVSPGCKGCYACAGNARTLPAWGTGLDYTVPNRENVEIFLDEKVLLEPLSWKKPCRVFPCSMTDMFAEFVTDEMIERIFGVMRLSPQHTFLPLTKRADRMYEWFKKYSNKSHAIEVVGVGTSNVRSALWIDPLDNVHPGVSVETQEWADKRIPWLLRCPAALRWISYEPALGPINWFTPEWSITQGNIRQIVIGGESGPGARPFDIKWAIDTIKQAGIAHVACFLKQLGAFPVTNHSGLLYDTLFPNNPREERHALNLSRIRLKDKKGGDMEEWPHGLRVREYPTTMARAEA